MPTNQRALVACILDRKFLLSLFKKADDSDVSRENISDSSGESFDLRTALHSQCHNFYRV